MFQDLKILKKYCKWDSYIYIENNFLYFSNKVVLLKKEFYHPNFKFKRSDFLRILKNPEFYQEWFFAWEKLEEYQWFYPDLQDYCDKIKDDSPNYRNSISSQNLDIIKFFENPIIFQYELWIRVLNKDNKQEIILIALTK